MPLDVDKLVGASAPPRNLTWTWRDVALYHLAVGAQADQLHWVYERDLRPLPSFIALRLMPSIDAVGELPGFDADINLLLHGEQTLELNADVPLDGTAAFTGSVTSVVDKGPAAVLTVATEGRTADGQLLATGTTTLFVRGAGGCGDAGSPPPRRDWSVPDRGADATDTSATLPQQAALYRLTGDLNVLHVDPAVAAEAGFDRPILHGMCTHGVALRQVVDRVLGGDASRVAAYATRFTGVVLPGETLDTELWVDDNEITLRTTVRERQAPALVGVVSVKGRT